MIEPRDERGRIGRRVGPGGRGRVMGMASASTPDLVVLLALRLRTLADEDAVSLSSGLERAVVDEQLAELEADGLVRHREGRLSGWMLTPTGRGSFDERLATELAESGARPAVPRRVRPVPDGQPPLMLQCTGGSSG